MRLLICFLLCVFSIPVAAESSHVEGSGSLSASASVDFRIVIPPHVRRDSNGSLEVNFSPQSGWLYTEDADGVVTLSKP